MIENLTELVNRAVVSGTMQVKLMVHHGSHGLLRFHRSFLELRKQFRDGFAFGCSDHNSCRDADIKAKSGEIEKHVQLGSGPEVGR